MVSTVPSSLNGARIAVSIHRNMKGSHDSCALGICAKRRTKRPQAAATRAGMLVRMTRPRIIGAVSHPAGNTRATLSRMASRASRRAPSCERSRSVHGYEAKPNHEHNNGWYWCCGWCLADGGDSIGAGSGARGGIGSRSCCLRKKERVPLVTAGGSPTG